MSYRICPVSGCTESTQLDSKKFCRKHGVPYKENPKCPKCGENVVGILSKFCEYCGTKLPEFEVRV
jgi:hypothetical protein